MKYDVRRNVENYNKKHRRKTLWFRIVSVLGCAVVFCTTYALILPAITMDNETFCGVEEHIHEEECYEQITEVLVLDCQDAPHEHIETCYVEEGGKPICGYADFFVHTHDNSCYDAEGELVCLLDEIAEHEHTEECLPISEDDENCIEETSELICTLEENDVHVHGDACYATAENLVNEEAADAIYNNEENIIEKLPVCGIEEAEGHKHGADCTVQTKELVCEEDTVGHAHTAECYTAAVDYENLVCLTEETEGHKHDTANCTTVNYTLVCAKIESDGHAHDESCYDEEGALVCGIEETEGHTHADECYTESVEIFCEIEETEGHAHTDECYASTDVLTCEMAETEAHVHTDDCYDIFEDFVCTLEETEGHVHSDECYEVTEEIDETEETEEISEETEEITEESEESEEISEETEEIIEEAVPADEDMLCGMKQAKLHKHNEKLCFDEYGNLVCGMIEVLEHIHDEDCFAYVEITEFPLTCGYEETADTDSEESDKSAETEENEVTVEIVDESEETAETEESEEAHEHTFLCRGEWEKVCEKTEHIHEEKCFVDPNIYTFSDDEVYVEVKLPEDNNVPNDAVLKVEPITDSDAYDSYLAQAEEAVDGTIENIALYDISFYTPEGEYIPVSDTAQVSMAFVESPVETDDNVQILHFEDDDSVPVMLGDIIPEEREIEMIIKTVREIAEEVIDAVEDEEAKSFIDSIAGAVEDFIAEITSDESETETVTEVVVEERTVVEFETNGFSTFAVVEVVAETYIEKGEPILGYSNVTNILTNDQIGSLNNIVVMISTAEAVDNKYYYVSSEPKEITTTNNTYTQLVAGELEGNDGTIINVGTVDYQLWKFEKVENKDNVYYINLYNTNSYINIGGKESNNLTISENKQEIIISAVDGDSKAVYLRNNEEIEQNRYLSYTDNTNGTFSSYKTVNETSKLVLSVPTIATTVLATDNVVSVGEKSHPLAGKQIVISTRTKFSEKQYALTSVDETGNGNHLAGSIMQLSGDNVYVNQNGVNTVLWKFNATETPNVYVLESVANPGWYLQINGGNDINLLNNADNANCQITVSKTATDNNGVKCGEIVLLCDNEGRYLSFDCGNYGDQANGFTGYGAPNTTIDNNDVKRADLILSEVPKTEDVIIENVVTNLDGQTLAIVSIHNNEENTNKQAVTHTSSGDGNRLNGVDVNFIDDKMELVDIPDDSANGSLWYFTAVDGKPGVYYIRACENGKYLNISTVDINEEDNETVASVTLVDDPQEITVTGAVADGQQIVRFSVTDEDGKTVYLNRYTGKDGTEYCGYITNNAGDNGNNFILAEYAPEYDYVYKATVLSRAELRDAAKMPNAQLIFFVRQKDEADNYHYYAMSVKGGTFGSEDHYVGQPVEIYLEGDTLEDGSIMYVTTDSENIRWDATSTPDETLDGNWNGSNNVNRAIDLLAKNVGADLFLAPNSDGGYGGPNVDDTDGANYHGVSSITSMVETKENGAPWYNNEDRIGMPLRAKHNASFMKINKNNQNFDDTIASMIMSDNEYGDTDTAMTDGTKRIYYIPETRQFEAGEIANYGIKDAGNDIDNYAFYVAIIDNEVVNHDTVVGKVLTREEYREVVNDLESPSLTGSSEYNSAEQGEFEGAQLPVTNVKNTGAQFMIFTRVNGKYYAMAVDGSAHELEMLDGSVLNGNELEATSRLVFRGSLDYNTNNVLWDASLPTGSEINDLNGWIDLVLKSAARQKLLSPHEKENGDLKLTNEAVRTDYDLAFGLSYVNDEDVDQDIANYIGSYSAEDDPDAQYRIVLDKNDMVFEVVKGWGGSESLSDRDYIEGEDFYIAWIVDREETTENDTVDIEDYYEVIPGVNENVEIHLFNYGSAINEYAATYNVPVNNNGVSVPSYNIAEMLANTMDGSYFRFFHREAFHANAIDGINEYSGEYVQNDPYDRILDKDILNIEYYRYLDDEGYPIFKQKDNAEVAKGYLSLRYLFDKTVDSVASPQAIKIGKLDGYKVNDDDKNGTIDDNEINPAYVAAGEAYNINIDNGFTPIANFTETILHDADEIAQNSNYAVRHYNVGQIDSETGLSTTGLFQRDFEGYFYYDSGANAAWYNPETQLFELYDYTVFPSGASDKGKGGNFLPFNKAHEEGYLWDGDYEVQHDEYAGQLNEYQGWHEYYDVNERIYRMNGINQTDDPNLGRDSMSDLWVGMTLEFDFEMTADGQVVKRNADGEMVDEEGNVVDDPTKAARMPMDFCFAGDDDVLIYIDDVLVLDISGIHGIEKGEIDFQTGELIAGDKLTNAQYSDTNKDEVVTIYEMFMKAIEDQPVALEAAGLSFTDADFVDMDKNGVLDTFAPNTTHHLKMFYLERGGNISDCMITFNLEPLPKGSLSIQKDVDGLDEDDKQVVDGDFREYAGEYTFQLIDVMQPTNPLTPAKDEVPYQITKSTTETVTEEGENGEVVTKEVTTEKTISNGVLALNKVTKTIDDKTYYVYRYGENKESGVDLYVKDGEDIYYTYNDGELKKYTVSSQANLYQLYESEEFTLSNHEKITFSEFTKGTLLKVKEKEAVNGVQLGTSYWWTITDLSGDDGTPIKQGQHEGTVDGDGAHISEYFVITDTQVDIVCKNVLQPVNLGIRKQIVNQNGETVEFKEGDEFSITYTITYPKSDYFKMDETKYNLYEYNLDKDDQGNNVLTEDALLRETYTNTWVFTKDGLKLSDGTLLDYGKITDTTETLNDSDFYPRNKKIVEVGVEIIPAAVGAQPYEDYFIWTVNVPFGSRVIVEEITVDGYIVSWDYEGWDVMTVPVLEVGADIVVDNNETSISDLFTDNTTEYVIGDYTIVKCDDDKYVVLGKNGVLPTPEALTAIGLDNNEYNVQSRYVQVYGKDGEGSIVFAGYEKDASGTETDTKIGIKLLATDNYITIYNQPTYTLPETGGRGVHWYTYGGLSLMIGGASLLMYRTKKRRKEGHSV